MKLNPVQASDLATQHVKKWLTDHESNWGQLLPLCSITERPLALLTEADLDRLRLIIAVLLLEVTKK